jgi:hypothetical protein
MLIGELLLDGYSDGNAFCLNPRVNFHLHGKWFKFSAIGRKKQNPFNFSTIYDIKYLFEQFKNYVE